MNHKQTCVKCGRNATFSRYRNMCVKCAIQLQRQDNGAIQALCAKSPREREQVETVINDAR